MGIFSRAFKIAESYFRDTADPYTSIKNEEDDELRRIIDELNRESAKKNRESKNSSNSGSQGRPAASNVKADEIVRACRILGVEENCSVEEIKAAYKKKIRQHHPDRAATLSKDKQAEAERLSREINRSYQVLREDRKF